MPTAVDYATWGSWFEDKAGEMAVLLHAPLDAAGPDAVAGGLLAVTVDVTLRAAANNATAAAARFHDLADECARRAEICRTYDSDMRAYEAALASYDRAIVEYGEQIAEAEASGEAFDGMPPRRPEQPSLPAPWVERSWEDA